MNSKAVHDAQQCQGIRQAPHITLPLITFPVIKLLEPSANSERPHFSQICCPGAQLPSLPPLHTGAPMRSWCRSEGNAKCRRRRMGFCLDENGKGHIPCATILTPRSPRGPGTERVCSVKHKPLTSDDADRDGCQQHWYCMFIASFDTHSSWYRNVTKRVTGSHGQSQCFVATRDQRRSTRL